MNKENSSELLEGWAELGDVCKIEKGTSITKATITRGDVPVIAGGRQPAYYHNVSNRDGRTITVSASGYAGFVNYFECPIFASDCITIKTKDENILATKFVFHFLKSRQEDIYKLQKGTAQQHVYGKDLVKIKIPVPLIEVQKEIVQEIEKQFTRLDAAVKSLKEVKNKLEVYRKSVLKAAFEGKLVPFGDSLKDKLISNYCKKVRQINPKKEGFSTFLYLDIASIDNKQNNVLSPKTISSENAPSRARQETFPGDIVYSTVRVYLMNLAVVPEVDDQKIISSTGFTVLRPSEELNNKFLLYYLLSDGVTNFLTAKQRGTSYPAIRDGDIFGLNIKVPKIDIQEEIVYEIESRFSVIDKLEETVDNALLKAEQLRKSILKSAFEGKLVKFNRGGEK